MCELENDSAGMDTTLVTFTGILEAETPNSTTTSRCAPVAFVAMKVASIASSLPHCDALDAPLNLYASPLIASVNLEDVNAKVVAFAADTVGTTGGSYAPPHAPDEKGWADTVGTKGAANDIESRIPGSMKGGSDAEVIRLVSMDLGTFKSYHVSSHSWSI